MGSSEELNCINGNENKKVIVNLNSKNSGLENFLRRDKLIYIAKLIKDRIDEIKKLKDKSSKEIYKELKSHDSILIDGKRGSGKTTFLFNLIDCLKKTNNINVRVFEIIDPAVIHSTTKDITDILLLFISKLFNNFSEHIDNLSDSDKKDNNDIINKIYTMFEDLNSIATDGLYFNEHHSIDRFSAMSKAITTDFLLHELFFQLTKYYKVDILVLFIDDIDMEFDIAFDVIDIVRRYFASPYIIPILAFDSAQAYGIIKKNYLKHFDYDASKNLEKINSSSELEFLKILPREFMLKVFPPDRRVVLDDMLSIYKYYQEEEKTFLISYKRDNLEYIFDHKTLVEAFINIVYGFYQKNFSYVPLINYLENKSKRSYVFDLLAFMDSLEELDTKKDKEELEKLKKEYEIDKNEEFTFHYFKLSKKDILKNRFSKYSSVFSTKEDAVIEIWNLFIFNPQG